MMPDISLEEDTVERLDALRVEDESYDEIISSSSASEAPVETIPRS